MGLIRWIPVLACALAIAGCGRSDSARDVPASQRAAALARTNELIIALQSDGLTLDPHRITDAASMRLAENLYSTLLRYAETYGEYEPDLATDWALADDGLTYTFTLHPDAVFQASGEPVTAEDVVYSIDRIREHGVRSDHFEPIRSVTALDTHTVQVKLDKPYAPLLSYLAHPMNAIVDRRIVENGGLDQAGGGSGPFQLKRWRRDHDFRMERNPTYFVEDRPRLDAVTFRPIADSTSRITALRNGEIDVILDVSVQDVHRLTDISGVEVISVPGTFWEYMGLNTERPPFDDVRVRQAIAWAVDRDAVNTLVKFGQATPLRGGPIPPNHWAHYDEAVYPAQDLNRARALLTEAGHAGGLHLELLVGSDFGYQVQAAEVIKQQLRPLDIHVTVQSLESGMFFNRLGERDFQMSVVGWLGFVDPDEWTYNLFHSSGSANQQSYRNETVDALLVEGREISEPTERKPIYDRVQRLIAEEAPMVFLYINDRTAAMLDDVRAFDAHPTVTTLSLRDTWLER